MSECNNVFVSYRRDISGYTALAVFQYLWEHGIDAFVDYKSIPAGKFEPVILGQIAARPYFVVVLAPGCLKRCNEPEDWLRREIEYAMELKRKIIPLLTSNFDFKARYAKPYLTGKLAELPSYEAQKAPLEFFEEAMDKLRDLLRPIDLPTTPTSDNEKAIVRECLKKTASLSPVTKQQLTAQKIYEGGMARPETDTDRRIEDCNEALRFNPEFAVCYDSRASMRAKKKDYVGAIADVQKALELWNDSYDAEIMQQKIAEWLKQIKS